jgi:hypothetical protein
MTAPDKLAGKTVRCPKCAAAFTVPAPDAGFEVVEDDEPVVAKPRAKPPAADPGFEIVEDEVPVMAKPRKKPRPPVVVDDDDDDEDRTPRKKKKAKKGLSPVLLYGSIVGVVLLLGVGVGIYFLTSGKGGGGGLFGPSWTKFDAPDGSFSASFPGGSPETGDAMSLLSGSSAKPQEVAQAKKAMEQMGMSLSAWSRTENNRKYVVGCMTIPPQMATMVKPDQLMSQNFNMQNLGGGKVESQEDTTVSGQKAKQILGKSPDGKNALMRIFIADNKIYFIGVESDEALKADDGMARQFFDKFELKKK